MIPYGRQSIDQSDIDAVVDVLTSDFLTQGPVVAEFERSVSDYTNSKYAVASNSATSSLHVACLALGLGEGDILWTSPITFVASANCGLYCGATVDFVDIDPKTYNMSVEALSEKLEQAERDGVLPKVVVPVHFSGQPCDMQQIGMLAKKFNFKVIEDASHAIGARYQGEKIGNCRYSDVTVFSFHPVKIVTSAEGGMATTNDAEIATRMKRLGSQGTTRNPLEFAGVDQGPWYYEQIDLGFNYRMTELQAALGRSQVQRIDTFLSRRVAIAERYTAAFSSLPLTVPYQSTARSSAWHLYVVQIENKDKHRSIFEDLRARGIGVNLHYIPVHTQPFYAKMGFQKGDFPCAEAYYQRAISLPLFPDLTDENQQSVIATLKELVTVGA
jgi:UDP-4-amino-4,6-dideoxy-N-acetyl-beta-L-altrosamine transaminase